MISRTSYKGELHNFLRANTAKISTIKLKKTNGTKELPKIEEENPEEKPKESKYGNKFKMTFGGGGGTPRGGEKATGFITFGSAADARKTEGGNSESNNLFNNQIRSPDNRNVTVLTKE
jgi:hypothetical protein